MLWCCAPKPPVEEELTSLEDAPRADPESGRLLFRVKKLAVHMMSSPSISVFSVNDGNNLRRTNKKECRTGKESLSAKEAVIVSRILERNCEDLAKLRHEIRTNAAVRNAFLDRYIAGQLNEFPRSMHAFFDDVLRAEERLAERFLSQSGAESFMDSNPDVRIGSHFSSSEIVDLAELRFPPANPEQAHRRAMLLAKSLLPSAQLETLEKIAIQTRPDSAYVDQARTTSD